MFSGFARRYRTDATPTRPRRCCTERPAVRRRGRHAARQRGRLLRPSQRGPQLRRRVGRVRPGGWTPETYDRAAAAAPNDADRTRLAADLVATIFTGYAQAGEWLDIADGLVVMTQTTKNLGYDGLVLFLDELVLWLASHAADAAFVVHRGVQGRQAGRVRRRPAGRPDRLVRGASARAVGLRRRQGRRRAARPGRAGDPVLGRPVRHHHAVGVQPARGRAQAAADPPQPEAAAQVAQAVAAVKASRVVEHPARRRGRVG